MLKIIKRAKRYIWIMPAVLFLFNAIIPTMASAQEAVAVMTLFEKNRYYAEVTMTPAQLSALAGQAGITISSIPEGTVDQIIISIPAGLGGGFIVAEPAALAEGMNAVGITTVATETAVLGAIAAEGAITKGTIVKIATIEQQIQMDVNAKVPLSTILNNALDSGMTLEEALSAILKAGVDPAVLTYEAITNGYPADTVVEIVIKSGAPLEQVVSAAIGAGADPKVISGAAIGAGAPPSQVADSIANFTAPGAQVFGFTPPAPPAFPTVPVGGAVGGGGFGRIGGGGGGVDCEASPSKPECQR